MTFYIKQIKKLSKELYPKKDVNQRIVLAKKYIDKRYMDSIDLDWVCRKAAFSKYHFIRLFRKLYGITPHQYLREVRVARAKELIESGMTVRGACFSVGFDSPNSFSSLFKKITGKPPSTF